jgi:DNA-directed RNA polymerase specialized sigma24 family protein
VRRPPDSSEPLPAKDQDHPQSHTPATLLAAVVSALGNLYKHPEPAQALLRHRGQRQSLGQIAKTFTISRATVSRIIIEEAEQGVTKGVLPATA